jgi:hypothetical protein
MTSSAVPGFRLDHQHGIAGAGDDEIELRFFHFVDMGSAHIRR